MRWIKGEDHPKEPGQYHCNIESENFKGKSIHKDTCWFSSGGVWLTEYSNQRVVTWLDETIQDVPDTVVGEGNNVLVCYFCGKPYDHLYEECECGCACITITVPELAAENLRHKNELSKLKRQSIGTPAPGEVPADQDKQPFEKYPVLCEYIQQLASFGHVDNWTNFLVQINTLCAQLTEATTSRNVLQNQAANATKDMGKLLEDLLKISEERDAYYQLFKELGDILEEHHGVIGFSDRSEYWLKAVAIMAIYNKH